MGKSPVEDFERWKLAFANNESYRAEHGEIGYQIFQTVENPNEIVVLFEWDENEDPLAFFHSDGMRERMTEAGLQGPPELTLVELVDRKSVHRPSA